MTNVCRNNKSNVPLTAVWSARSQDGTPRRCSAVHQSGDSIGKDGSDDDSVIMNLKVNATDVNRREVGALGVIPPEPYNVAATTVPATSTAAVTDGEEWTGGHPSYAPLHCDLRSTSDTRSISDMRPTCDMRAAASSEASVMLGLTTSDDMASVGPRVVMLLRDFAERTRTTGEWPASTSVCCYWCCHRFSGAPFGLPVKLVGKHFYATGCFCSLECATAYNFGGRDSTDQALERYTLINALAARLGLCSGTGRCAGVRPAPDRLALHMFGGHLDIDSFRRFCTTGRHVIVNTAPMQTLTTQLEEVPEADMRSEYRYVPLDMQRVTRFQEKIRLRRKNPLVNPRNTLDSTMNLRYVSSGSEVVPAGDAQPPMSCVPPTMGGLPPSTAPSHAPGAKRSKCRRAMEATAVSSAQTL